MPKRQPRQPSTYFHPKYHEAISWCFANNIKITLQPTQSGPYPPCHIIIHNGQTNNISPIAYPQDGRLNDKVTQLYIYYWEKYSGQQ